ncbi:HAD family hydrolase [Clostridium thermosuccinogenes]|uniref:HAD family hydrolase n=1 Tax=Clostridium thermosuccinogenes TaxID=84032 RepID=UPI000CCBFE64|nr:HAD family phosphatase [Pseudoclostridium thermosuccinogenes]PNT90977.1 HAD family hydrolase [Pseudoclostridium thermosuccinogenes]
MVCKNIIFDIGNVLLSFKPLEHLKTKILDPDKASEIYKQVFLSEEWLMLDRGTITEEEAINALAGRNPQNGHWIRLAFENWYDILTPIEDNINIARDLKAAGYNIYYLSNFQSLAFDNITRRYDFFKLFDGGIVSFKEKLIKPEEGIYKRLLEEYRLLPEESVFIDDTQVNIEAAAKLNFKTILFTGAEDLRKKLKAYGICF